jgi:hypothetical protein
MLWELLVYVLYYILFEKDGEDYDRNGRDELWRRKHHLIKVGVLSQKGEEKMHKIEQ